MLTQAYFCSSAQDNRAAQNGTGLVCPGSLGSLQQIIVPHTGVQHLAGKQLSQATCENCRESMGISGCGMCQKWMCLGCTILCRGCLAGFCDDHCSQLTHRCPDLLETDTRLAFRGCRKTACIAMLKVDSTVCSAEDLAA